MINEDNIPSVSRFQEKEKRGDNNNDNIKMITFADHEKL